MKKLLKYGVLFILTLFIGAFFLVQTPVEAIALQTNPQVVVETAKENVLQNSIESDSKSVGAELEVKTENAEFSEKGSSLGSEVLAEGMAFRATGYCLRGKTASGAMVRRGIVAADPRVLPLGTRISLSNAGRYNGQYVVGDTGGVIKGRILDIWVPSCGEAISWGRRSVTVSIIGRGGKSKAAK